jgi:(p)ppGpp synthase/HD superfamily hydrolase
MKMDTERFLEEAGWIMDDRERAIAVATFAHHGQRRKYCDVPYITHPLRVMERVADYSEGDYGSTHYHRLCSHSIHIDMICGAVLHDVLEDTHITKQQLDDLFCIYTVDYVVGMTNVSKQTGKPRAERKKMDRDRLAACSAYIQIIKMFDRLDNLDGLYEAPPGFARLFVQESRELIEAIGSADRHLAAIVLEKCEDVDEHHSS